MDVGNQTGVLEFLLVGLSEDPELQPLLFGLFLSMYLVSLLGNLLIILAVSSDSRFHTPLYFFLSFSDICFNSTIVPKMLVNIQRASQAITYAGCFTQMYFYLVFLYLDHFLLTVMAFDRSWCVSVLVALLQSLLVLHLSFCTHMEIPHFFCELADVLKAACSDALSNYLVLYAVTGLLGVPPLTGILFSYSKIISFILKMSSEEGRYKAFSTCGSHLMVISLFYGTGFGVYLSSAYSSSSSKGAVASVMYTVVTPMLNPFIYSLRNRDMKGALRNLLLSRGAPGV
uniref:G-protein coupled receptors family 1 profile domain-containing protein n=1 Tax=Catagonus wagneri TaxID=51154 RepID=A0A8C3W6C0_9CETA